MRRPNATVVSAQRIGAISSARARSRSRRGELRVGHALDIGDGRFAGPFGLERLGVLFDIGEQRPMADADLLEQLTAPRALRREVDEAEARRRAIRCARGSAHSR